MLLGESGSGKSTLLSMICGTVLVEDGSVEVAGQDLSKLSAGQRDRLRAEQIGVIFQQFNLLPFGTVLDNVLLPLNFAPQRKSRVGDGRAVAAKLCTDLGLPPGVMFARARDLSVGQQQRVAVARALIGTPRLIVADEPTSALDAQSQALFLQQLFDQAAINKTSVLMVSHDERLGDQFDRVVRMEDITDDNRVAA